jgi:hypothetical protein
MAWSWNGLTVLQISPQRWDDIKLSKHHYAMEMAALGAHVHFLEPPNLKGSRGVTVTPVAPNISVVRYVPFFPYALKFRARPLFNLLMRRQARLIARAIAKPIDFVWDFDNAYQFTDLSVFGARRSAFHLMDAAVKGLRGDKKADLVLSVSGLLLDAVRPLAAPTAIVSHGLGRAYVSYAKRKLAEPAVSARPGPFRRVGYVGTLFGAVDRQAILDLVVAFPDIEFHFVGPAAMAQATAKGHGEWLKALAAQKNCVLHGRQDADFIVGLADTIDAWLVCYGVADDINQGADSHKILEYLAMGAPVLSSWIAAYDGSPLLAMAGKGSNADLIPLLRGLAADTDARGPAARADRMRYALDHSYEAKIAAVGELLDGLAADRSPS